MKKFHIILIVFFFLLSVATYLVFLNDFAVNNMLILISLLILAIAYFLKNYKSEKRISQK